MDEELNAIKDNDIKENMSTCDDVVEVSHPTSCDHTSPTCSKTNHDREKQLEEELESMTKCMFNVTRGEYLHKEILFHNARHLGTNGLGLFPKPPENCSGHRSSMHASTRKLAHIANIIKSPGIIQGSVQFLLAHLLPFLLITSLNSVNIICC